MKATIVFWNLDQSDQTIETLQKQLKEEGIDAWKKIDGMQFKCWISDTAKNLWGALMIWESEAHMHQPLPPNRALELIGYPPQFRTIFDIEATTFNFISS
jgi:hypothetical protein